MLATTRRTFAFRDRPLHSTAALLRSKIHFNRLQEVRLADDVPLIADRGHPNRCYAWTGELSWTVAAAIAALLRPGDNFLDIGSFCGQHAMRAARLVGPDGTVVAVEPDPRSLAWLRRNLDAAKLSQTVDVRPVAAVPDRHPGRVQLRLAPISMSSVTSEEPPTEGVQQVDSINFDQLLSQVQPDLVKIDVEGLDAALVASSTWLRAADAPALIVEMNDGVASAVVEAGYGFVELQDLVASKDRGLYNISSDILAYKPDSLDVRSFSFEFTAQLDRLRKAPSVRYL